MPALIDKVTPPGNRGSHYNKGSDHLYYVNEAPAQIWRQPVNPATQIMQQTARVLVPGLQYNLNGVGSGDLRWVTGTTKQVQGQNRARVAKLSNVTSLEQIAPESLGSLAWDTISDGNNVDGEDGLSTAGNFYAVRIPLSLVDPQYHYAKVRIFRDAAANATKIEWATYVVGTRPTVLHVLNTELAAPRDLFVNEFDTEIYVSGGSGAAGYVVKYQRIVGGAFPQYFNTPVPLNDPSSATPLLSPQQMVVDGGSVYVVAEGGLFLLQSDGGGQVQVQVVSGIASPVGLLLDKQRASTLAYISDIAGQVYAVDISQFAAPTFDANGNQSGVASAPIEAGAPVAELALGGPSGFLTWTDDAHTAFYAPVRGSTGKIKRVDLLTKLVSDELTSADPAVPDPWSVEVFAEGSLSVVCDAAIVDIERGIVPAAELALGIGLVPFQLINKSKDNPLFPEARDGWANTSSVPGYYFSSNGDLAFGGSLSLLINHQGAWNSNLRFYKVSFSKVSFPGEAAEQPRAITNGFTDLRWNAALSPPRFEGVTTGVQNGGYFPVRRPGDLWYNPYLAAIINTGLPDKGHNRLKLDFFESSTATVPAVSYTRLLYVDNTRSNVTLSHMRRGSATVPPASGDYVVPDACGLIPYTSKEDLVEFDLTAVHPSGAGRYSISFARGSKTLFSFTGNLTPSATPLTVREFSAGVPLRVGHLIGNCNIANITVHLSAPTPAVINGYGWVNLGSSISRSFTLAPAQQALSHTPWPQALQGTTPESRPMLLIDPSTMRK